MKTDSKIASAPAATGVDRRALLQRMAVGFLPLVLFLFVDTIWGLTAGLIAAILIGLVELVWIYAREKRLDRFVLIDTGLIVGLGLVSLLLQNDIFFKIKPGLIQLIFVLLVGLTAFSKHPILIKMTGRYLRGMNLTPQQEEDMRSMMRRLFWLIAGHTLLVFYAAFFMSTEAWVFISGGLFYFLMGVVLIGEFGRQRWKLSQLKQKMQNEEWFDIVQEDGRILGKALRSAVHGNPDLLHATVHLNIVNARQQLYLQRRADTKDLFPGYWDTAVGGHVNSGEKIESALIRESKEELGIDLEKATFQPLFRYVHRNEFESELVHTFLLRSEGPFTPNKAEISAARFWSVPAIRQELGKQVFTPNFEQEFELLERMILKPPVTKRAKHKPQKRGHRKNKS